MGLPLMDVSFDRWEDLVEDCRKTKALLCAKSDVAEKWSLEHLEAAIGMSFRLEEFIRKMIKVNRLNTEKANSGPSIEQRKEATKKQTREAACLKELYMVLCML